MTILNTLYVIIQMWALVGFFPFFLFFRGAMLYLHSIFIRFRGFSPKFTTSSGPSHPLVPDWCGGTLYLVVDLNKYILLLLHIL